MLIDEKIQEIQKLTKRKITYAEIGRVFGLTRSAVQNWALRKKHLEEYQIQKLDETFLKQNDTKEEKQNNDIVKIPYWSQLPEELKNPDFTCVTAERKVILNHWYLQPEDLCIVPMVGDKMERYWYPINNGDILIVDLSQHHIRGNGVYFATSQNNTRFWIREMQVLVNNNIEFKGFAPSGETVRTLTQEELNKVDFKIIGKVIKNVSFRL